MKKKEYSSPEFDFVTLCLQNIVLASSPEDLNSQVNGGSDWGEDDGDEIIN